ncbi:hypothetical protein BKP35_03830 [Anaerobacillus arseniciselenatis]|uniref:DUF4190 domain-containing protein n=2 Tax=Anaerobacillus arseniciselenatis TaxID=85682 RepID=A0A1S2LWT5_9BACI|nr:hypothetical protein BKP35_03830 [Anaerobacillus arseniciselenatis]
MTMTDINNRNQDNRSLHLENEERDENPNGVTSADYPNGDHREETAAEFAPTRGFVGERPFAEDVDEENEVETADGHAAEGRGVGAFAIVLSIISLFFLPVILGAAGIIVGFIARRNGATGLGNWAIGIGAVSIILTLFFSPFF